MGDETKFWWSSSWSRKWTYLVKRGNLRVTQRIALEHYLGDQIPQNHRQCWKYVYNFISIDAWLWHGAHCIKTKEVNWYMNIKTNLWIGSLNVKASFWIWMANWFWFLNVQLSLRLSLFPMIWFFHFASISSSYMKIQVRQLVEAWVLIHDESLEENKKYMTPSMTIL